MGLLDIQIKISGKQWDEKLLFQPIKERKTWWYEWDRGRKA